MRLLGWRSGKWPTVALYQPMRTSRGDIKTMSVDDLERLQAVAAANSEWSATGRPAWIRARRDRVRQVLAVVFVVEHPGVYRCLVTVVLDDGSAGQFTLEVSFRDFDRLTDVSAGEVVTLAHRYLLTIPDVPLDPEQQAAWDRLKER